MKASLRTLLAVFTGESIGQPRKPLPRISHPDMGIPMVAPLHPILHLNNKAEVGFLFWLEDQLLCFDNSQGRALLLAHNPLIGQEFPFMFKGFPDVAVVGLFKKESNLVLRIIADDIWIAKAPILDHSTLWPIWEVGESLADNKLVGLIEIAE